MDLKGKIGGGTDETQYRRHRLLLWLLKHSVVSFEEIFDEIRPLVNSRRSTLRKDLMRLEEESELIKYIENNGRQYVIGFSSFLRADEEGHSRLFDRMSKNLYHKLKIAEEAFSQFIGSGDDIYIGSGSTTLLLGVEITLNHYKVDITTDNLGLIDFAPKASYSLKVVQGNVAGSRTTIRVEPLNESATFQKTFIGFEGFNEGKFTCRSDFVSRQREIVEHSDTVIFLGDYSKLGSSSGKVFYTLEDLWNDDITTFLITTNESGEVKEAELTPDLEYEL